MVCGLFWFWLSQSHQNAHFTSHMSNRKPKHTHLHSLSTLACYCQVKKDTRKVQIKSIFLVSPLFLADQRLDPECHHVCKFGWPHDDLDVQLSSNLHLLPPKCRQKALNIYPNVRSMLTVVCGDYLYIPHKVSLWQTEDKTSRLFIKPWHLYTFHTFHDGVFLV